MPLPPSPWPRLWIHCWPVPRSQSRTTGGALPFPSPPGGEVPREVGTQVPTFLGTQVPRGVGTEIPRKVGTQVPTEVDT